jgi:hypothetical protein
VPDAVLVGAGEHALTIPSRGKLQQARAPEPHTGEGDAAWSESDGVHVGKRIQGPALEGAASLTGISRKASQRSAIGVAAACLLVVVVILAADRSPEDRPVANATPSPTRTATATPTAAPTATPAASRQTAPRQFAPTSFWNATIPDDVKFSEESLEVDGQPRPVNPTVGQELQAYASHPDGSPNTYVNHRLYASRIVVVPPDQELEPVRLCRLPDDCVPSWARSVDQLLRGVDVRGRYLGGGLPIPKDVPVPSPQDRDASIVFYQPEYRGRGGRKGRIYELWRFRRDETFDSSKPIGPENTRFKAEWGGRIVGVNQQGVGHYADCMTAECGYQADVTRDPSAWGRPDSQAESRFWGVTASALPMTASQMSLADCVRGALDHGIGIQVPRARRGEFWWPAQRSDGFATDKVVAEGMRLTFKRGATPPPELTAVGRAVWDAAYKYGLVIDDQTRTTLTFRAEPGCERTELFTSSGVPTYELMRNFPWEDLQVIEEGSDTNPNPTE